MSFWKDVFAGPVFEVPVGQCAVEYRDGQVSRILPPGRHRVDDEQTRFLVDMRAKIITLAGQDITTAEAVTLRVSMALTIRVVDPVRYLESAADPEGALYLAAQIALREVLVGVPVEDLLGRADAVDLTPVRTAVAETGAATGIESVGVYLKDIVVPHEIRSAAVELMTAKARGAARLEEARAETAALRALANAGKMLDASPALARLRMLQALPYGAKVVIGLDGTENSAAAAPE